MSYDWLSIISLILWLIVPIIVFVARHWIIAVVSRGVQHQFDREIEQLRTELRKAEEEHRSQLRSKEADIAALRNVVLTGSAGRQALLDKRRLEAVEKVWTAVNDLGQLKGLSSTMAILNYSAFAKEASNPRAQQLLSVIGKTAPADLKELKNVARDERPFLTESAWAYFHAYRMILYMTLVRYHFLKSFVTPGEDPEKYFSVAALRNILKAALPHQSKFIDENDAGAFHYLLDELEAYLLGELRKILDGKDADQVMTERAKAIMAAVNESEKEAIRKQAEESIPETIL